MRYSRAHGLCLLLCCSLTNPLWAQSGSTYAEPNTTTAADSVITFNEVMYHPAGDDPGMEWVEVYNQMSVNMDISRWEIEGGIEFRFPTNTVLNAGSYLVIASNPARLQALTGLTNIFGPFTNFLSNSGETLRLRNQSGRLMDEMQYSDEDPWPVGPDGSGASLSKRERYNASSPAANWRASAQAGGTPGRVNFDTSGVIEAPAIPLVVSSTTGRWLVPAGEVATNWTTALFDDTLWTAGTASIGYDTGTTGPVLLGNVAVRKNVIDGSGAYSNNPYNVPDAAGDFVAQNVTDGSLDDIFGVNYWLGRQGRIGEYFTLDLGQNFQIEEIHLRNTHNTQHNDRGTAEFEIWASQSIDSNKQPVTPVRILTGTLTDASGMSPLPTDKFTSADGLVVTNARYLKFVAVTANNAGNNVGLNEIEVYAPTFSGPNRAYSFNGDFADRSGNGFNGQNTGTQFSTNVPAAIGSGQSIALDGIANQVQVPDPVSPSAYTISMWVNVETVQSSGLILRTDAGGPQAAWSHQLRINGSGRFEHYVFDGSGRSVAATNTIVPGVWYHVALTAESDGNIKIFINGAQNGGTTAITTLWPGGNQWRIGCSAGNAANFFRGRIDELAIWHSVLGNEAIGALATGKSPTQLGGYHQFFTTDVESAMHGRNSSLLVRFPFENASQTGFEQVTLRMRYADGFVAFLNGTEVARRNAPSTLEWNSKALTNRSDSTVINFETIDLSAHASGIAPGRNVLTVHALNSATNDAMFLLSAELTARAAQPGVITNVAFSEVAAAGSVGFFIELQNLAPSSASLDACIIHSSAGGTYRFPSNSIPAGALRAITIAELGFPIADGDSLFLLGPGGDLIDAVEIHNRARARPKASPDDAWFYAEAETPNQPNVISNRGEIVINEIMYHHAPRYRTKDQPYTENDEQWIELYNKSNSAVDLSGWRLDGEVAYVFPAGTIVGADSYLVVANNASAVRARYPDILVTGTFTGRLSHHSARLILRDLSGNPADEVRYHNSHPWPEYANGGGSSLELRNPRADNAVSDSWGASDESAKAAWRRYSYRAVAVAPVYSPSIYSFHEFRLGLLDEGQVLIDNITVNELPTGAPARQLLQNTDFSTGTTRWRLLGNHSHSTIETDPNPERGSILRLVATGSTSYLDNRLETTLKSGGVIVPVVTGRQYEIAFDAKWLAGSPQVHTELYYNKVTATTILDMPDQFGTPGRRNSIYVPISGPTYYNLSHSPTIPAANQPITVTLGASDPDGLRSLQLYYAVNGATWRSVPMSAISTASDPTVFSGTIPSQVSGAVVQFYVQGVDSLGATSTFPAGGTNSRALIKVDSTRLIAGKQTFRTIMTPADSTLLHSAINMMSDDLLGCTVVHNEREVFYDAKIRLHGSMFSRNQPNLTGMTIKFPANHRFRGSRESVIVRRRGLVETIVKHILNSAGGLPGNYDDIVHLVSHRSDNLGTARMNLANYDDTYVDSQFEGDNDGTVFKLEGIREYQQTQNGNPEGLKLSQPIGWIQSFDIANLGNDQEQYRWGIMIQSNRREDDYSRIVAMGKAFSLSGTALKQAAGNAIDVDEWARLFALQSLLGIGDVYGVENPHNFAMYVRPGDGRVVGLQNDWEFAFSGSTSASIYGSKNVYKVLRLPGFQRMYQGHLLDLLDNVVNSSYLTPWARHYTTLIGESYNGVPTYASSRGAAVRSQLAARIPFEITSNGGLNLSVATPTITLEGRGWIDVYRIYRQGNPVPLPINWLNDQSWQMVLPLDFGTNTIELTAVNYRGVQVGQDSISVVTSAAEFPQRDYLRITELMYHPAPPSLAELSLGFTDADDFEFVELINNGPVALALNGVRFNAGITFDFSTGTITNLALGQRLVIVKNRAAFELRYGTARPIAGVFEGSLSNGGELVRLVDAFGGVIHEFTYGDAAPWPEAADGGGRSLEARNLDANYALPDNWQASAAVGGTPGTAEVRPMIDSVTVESGELRLTFQAAPGLTYEIYFSENLAAGAWTLLQQVAPQGVQRVEQVVDNASRKERFYRIVAF